MTLRWLLFKKTHTSIQTVSEIFQDSLLLLPVVSQRVSLTNTIHMFSCLISHSSLEDGLPSVSFVVLSDCELEQKTAFHCEASYINQRHQLVITYSHWRNVNSRRKYPPTSIWHLWCFSNFTEAKTFSEHFLQCRQNLCLYYFWSIYKNTTIMSVTDSLVSRRLQPYIIILKQRLRYKSTVFAARKHHFITTEQQIKKVGQKNTLINPFMICRSQWTAAVWIWRGLI